MSAYNGPALVIADHDAGEPVTASLSSYRDGLRVSWGGTLTPAREGLSRLVSLTAGRLQLPDGAEGEFLRPDTSDWVRTNRMKIIGQANPPF
jgi:hypothetical protein